MSPVTKFIDRYFYASMDIGKLPYGLCQVNFNLMQTSDSLMYFRAIDSIVLLILHTAVYHRVVIMTRDNPGL